MKLKHIISTHESLYSGMSMRADLTLHQLAISYRHDGEAEVYDFHPFYINYKQKITKLKLVDNI